MIDLTTEFIKCVFGTPNGRRSSDDTLWNESITVIKMTHVWIKVRNGQTEDELFIIWSTMNAIIEELCTRE